MAFNLSFMFSEKELLREAFKDLFQWLGDGSLTVANVTEYKLKDCAIAHRDLESGETVGKLVLLTHEDEKEEATEQKLEAEEYSDSNSLLETPT